MRFRRGEKIKRNFDNDGLAGGLKRGGGERGAGGGTLGRTVWTLIWVKSEALISRKGGA